MKAKAHIAGRLACLDGLNMTDNPHKSPRMRRLWREGFVEALEEKREKEQRQIPGPLLEESRRVATRLGAWARENL